MFAVKEVFEITKLRNRIGVVGGCQTRADIVER